MTILERQHDFFRKGHASQMSPTQALVWLALNDRTNGDGDCHPGLETIAQAVGHQVNAKTGKPDTKAVRRALDWLQTNGYVLVTVKATFHSPTHYRVLLPAGEFGPAPKLESTRGDVPTVGNVPTLTPAQSGQIALARVGNVPSPEWAMCPPKRTEKGTEKSTPAGARGFDRFWEAVPPAKQRSRPEAEHVWRRLNLDAVADRVIEGLNRWKRTPAWNEQGGRFAPSMTKFLEHRDWETNPQPVASPPPIHRRQEHDHAMTEIERERQDVNRALAGLELHVLQSLKGEVMRIDGEAGRLFEQTDPTDTSSKRAGLLRWRIVDLLRKRSPATPSSHVNRSA